MKLIPPLALSGSGDRNSSCLFTCAVLALPTKWKEERGRDDKSLYESALASWFGFIKMVSL